MAKKLIDNIDFNFLATKNTTAWEILKVNVESAGVLTGLFARFIAGEQGAVHLHARIIHVNGDYTDLVRYADGTNQYMQGEDMKRLIKLHQPVSPHDEIQIWWQNVDTVYDYDVFASLEIHYS